MKENANYYHIRDSNIVVSVTIVNAYSGCGATGALARGESAAAVKDGSMTPDCRG